MFNSLSLIRSERSLATMLAERDGLIESLVNQLEQVSAENAKLKKESQERMEAAKCPREEQP